MSAMTIVDVEVVPSNGVSFAAKAFAAETLGPMPGKWDGYDQLDESTSQELYGKVGYIHGLSAEAGRQIVAVGQTLLEMKEMLPHGQFMDCVKAEFGWSQPWAHQLMAVAERFSNHNSSYDLPSSAKVLALLASTNADDATVQQAAEEKWTVKQARQRLGNERQRERSVVQEALSVLKLSEEARWLASKAEHISTRQLMDALGVDEIPNGKQHQTSSHVFCKNGTGWWKLPVDQPVKVEAESPLNHSVTESSSEIAELLPLAIAAQRLGKKVSSLRTRLTPLAIVKNGGYMKGNGWQAEPSPQRGMCLVRKIG
jgi:hypothetical protein